MYRYGNIVVLLLTFATAPVVVEAFSIRRLSSSSLLLSTTPAPTLPTPSTTTKTRTTNTRCYATTGIETNFMWNAGLSFGKGQFKFYKGFNEWMSVFPEEDRATYPDTFQLPMGVYEVALKKPLGIVFEEFDDKPGVYVKELVVGGNAEKSGIVQAMDVLIGITAVKVVGAKYERRLIPARTFDFDTMVGAIGSNEERFACTDVVLMLERPSEADSTVVNNFITFFEPPVDNPWRQRQ
jgi:hypothetical protein